MFRWIATIWNRIRNLRKKLPEEAHRSLPKCEHLSDKAASVLWQAIQIVRHLQDK